MIDPNDVTKLTDEALALLTAEADPKNLLQLQVLVDLQHFCNLVIKLLTDGDTDETRAEGRRLNSRFAALMRASGSGTGRRQ